jgi:hypothetical protein
MNPRKKYQLISAVALVISMLLVLAAIITTICLA